MTEHVIKVLFMRKKQGQKSMSNGEKVYSINDTLVS